MSYTWSKNFSDFVDNLTGGSTPANAYDYSLERSFSPFDVTHRFVGYATWDLPFGKGKALLERRRRSEPGRRRMATEYHRDAGNRNPVHRDRAR